MNRWLGFLVFCMHMLYPLDPSIHGSPISSSSFTANTGAYEISSSGYYFLVDDLIGFSEETSKPLILISANNVVLDLGSRSITCSNENNITAGIQVADGVSNVTIKNGVISGITGTDGVTPPATDSGYGILINKGATQTAMHIVLEDLTIYSCGYFGLSISNCTDLTMNNIKCVGNGPAYNAATAGINAGYSGGAVLNNVHTVTIKDSSFCNNGWLLTSPTPSAANNIVGLYLNTCPNISLSNSCANNNSNISTSSSAIFVAGIYVVNSSNCLYNSIRASDNNMPATASANGSTYGIYLHGTESPFCSANIFSHCYASNNIGVAACYGFAIDSPSTGGSNSNKFIACDANLNSCNQTTIANSATVHGFHCLYTDSNSFTTCIADANYVNGSSSTASTAVRIVAGFYSAGSFSNLFFQCQANRNNVSSATAKTATYPFGSGVTFSYATGFQLGDQAIPAIETATIIRDCSANNNAALGAASTTSRAFGILILPIPASPSATNVSVQNTIEDTETFSNSTTSTTSGYYAYGIVDLTPGSAANSAGLTTPSSVGSTTFLRYNVSFGQGATFNVLQTSIRSFGSNNMNYFIDYAAGFTGANALNVIYETILGALDASNSDASLYGYKIYNLSLRQNVTS